MEALVLRWDAPLMSFGGVLVDQHGVTDRFPGQAMLTGLFGNALGWEHADAQRLQSLQARLSFAARWDVPPAPLVDYQTVDLGQEAMRWPGWTTRGAPEHRGKGEATTGTHQRFRHYWANGVMTVVVTLLSDGPPSLPDLREALVHPARPVFLGRKPCLPSRPLLDPTVPLLEGPNLIEILSKVAVWDRHGKPVPLPTQCQACWPSPDPGTKSSGARRVYDLRDWVSQLATGSRWREEGLITVTGGGL